MTPSPSSCVLIPGQDVRDAFLPPHTLFFFPLSKTGLMIRAHELDLADVRTDFDEGESERGGRKSSFNGLSCQRRSKDRGWKSWKAFYALWGGRKEGTGDGEECGVYEDMSYSFS